MRSILTYATIEATLAGRSIPVLVHYRQDVEVSDGSTFVSYEILASEVSDTLHLTDGERVRVIQEAEDIFNQTDKHFL
jgi:hypothetical protein